MEKLMKKLFCLLILPLTLFLACDTGSSDPGSNVDPGGNQMMVGAQVRDANGVLLGSLLDTTSYAIKVMTPESYIVFMDWRGNLTQWATYDFCKYAKDDDSYYNSGIHIYSTGVDMTGTKFMACGSTYKPSVYGKIAFAFSFDDSKIYTYRDLDESNIITVDTEFNLSYASYSNFMEAPGYPWTNEIGDFDDYPETDAAIVFREISRTELGLPATVAEGGLVFSIE